MILGNWAPKKPSKKRLKSQLFCKWQLGCLELLGSTDIRLSTVNQGGDGGPNLYGRH